MTANAAELRELLAKAPMAHSTVPVYANELAALLAAAEERDALARRLQEDRAILDSIRSAMGGGPYDTIAARITKLAAEVAGLRARIEEAPVVTVVENRGYTYVHKHYAPASADMLGKRVALLELPAPPVAGGGEQSTEGEMK